MTQSSLIAAGNLFTLIVGLPFQMYVARTLGAHSYGTFGLFETIAHTIAAVCSVGLAHPIVRFLPQHLILKEHDHARSLVRRMLGWTFVLALAAGAGAIAARPLLCSMLPTLCPFASLFWFIGAMTVTSMCIGIATQTLRAFADIRGMVLFSSGLQLTLKVAITALLFWGGWRLGGYLAAVAVSSGLAAIVMFLSIKRHLGRLPNTETRPGGGPSKREWWTYAKILYATSLIGIAVPLLERFLLAKWIGIALVGVLMAVRQLQGLVLIPLQIVNTVIAPTLVETSASGRSKDMQALYHFAVDWLARLTLPLGLFLLVFGHDVLRRYGEGFEVIGQLPLALLVVAQLLNVLAGPTGTTLNMIGQEKLTFRLGIVTSICVVTLLCLVAPTMGIVGVVIVTCASILSQNVVEIVALRKCANIRWWSRRYSRLLLPLVTCGVVAVLLSAAVELSSLAGMAGVLGSLYVLFIGTFVLQGLSQEDRDIVRVVALAVSTRLRRRILYLPSERNRPVEPS